MLLIHPVIASEPLRVVDRELVIERVQLVRRKIVDVEVWISGEKAVEESSDDRVVASHGCVGS